jgi:hypothetical protein
MSKLYWQFPWAGPMRTDSPAPEWAVLPSPGMGDAKAVCIPVTVQDSLVLLAVADRNQPIALVPAPLGVWTRVVGDPGKGSGFLCLLGYDQPEGGLGENYVVASGLEVLPADVDVALRKLHDQLGDKLAQRVLEAPAAPVGGAQPARAALAPMGQVERSEAVPGATTAPPPVSVTLAFASCQYASGLMDGIPAQASLQRLAELLRRKDQRRPERLLMLGDQIYADATAGLLDPIRLDDRYRVPYEELMRIEPLGDITAKIHSSWMLDDHEIVDNWEPDLQDSQADLLQRGLAGYWTHQRQSAPLPQTWYHLEHDGWHLFMVDTRTLRELRNVATFETASMLGPRQTQELEQWLLQRPPEDLKLVAGPAMLLPRLIEHLEEPLHLDGWQGYPASQHRLLAFLCDHGIENACFLSGDAHLGCDVAITLTGPDGKVVTTRSIHTPALYAPLPFANEQPWNLKLPDRFAFPGPRGTYQCEVQGKVFLPHQDGCCLLEADRAGTHWRLAARVLGDLS